ncbi:hypothetical protein L1987_13524 [Smallanthus sonchifolius]|uniref:Uncharacterized protein n=1 Tax=Smallanthus sonchifolius TaxID=185202 RepID=A0ACB9JHS7_9ASTR|nr:hypothetical protein L1987_13524 [Smallanthus sonchifolius]
MEPHENEFYNQINFDPSPDLTNGYKFNQHLDFTFLELPHPNPNPNPNPGPGPGPGPNLENSEENLVGGSGECSANSSAIRENGYEEERSSKQSAVYVEEDELSEMFDQVLLDCKEPPVQVNHKSQPNGSTGGSNENHNAREKTSKTVDLSTMLVSCAQAVAADDQRTATEQLNQIRRHASSWGDASQRLAHVFAIGIDARLAGTGSQLYAAKCASRISAAEKLQAYQVYLSACPFKKIAMSFANKTILDSEETGRRLANYCSRFNVSFEYNAIASQNWETITIQDLKLQRNEFLAVNGLARFQNLLDETVCVESPRDKILKLIHDMKPDIFVHSVVNGAYSAPFFVTRFRETLFHYSALFDMFDATIERENAHRLNFEKEFFGREAMNVIACEGVERVERPESYKQWQVRISRAGFKLQPLNHELVLKLRSKRVGYHKEFVFDEDGMWILQGWKGRILYSSSCWVPV